MNDKKSVYADNKLEGGNPNSAWTKLFNLVPEKSKVLDIGCSGGNLGAELIGQKGCSVVGIDLNEVDLNEAKKKLTKVYKRNVEIDKLDDLGKFDVILMADVIEHLVSPHEALIKVKKLLNKDGVLIFSVPNMANFATRIELLQGRFEYTDYGLLDRTHLHYYDRIEFERVMSDAGFKVVLYNNTLRDTPDKVLRQVLKKIGLSASEKFFKLARHPDSISFQFIGVAEPVVGKHAKIQSVTPHDFMSEFIDGLTKQHKEQEKNLIDINRRLATDNKQQKSRITELEAELHNIHSSKGWKLIKKGYVIKSKLTLNKRR